MLHYLLSGCVQKVVLGIILTINSLHVTPAISINPCEPKHAAHSSVIRAVWQMPLGPIPETR